MNDPSKRIDVEKSSLLSLKAELLRKQEEALKNRKAVPLIQKNKSVNKVNKSLDPKHEGVIKTSNAKVFEHDDSGEFKKSRKILEAKAKYYERMVNSKGSLNSDDNSLVLFNKKGQHEKRDSNEEDEDEMVDYTDCFGRSRKISKKELQKLKDQDSELLDVVESRSEQVNRHNEGSKSPGEISHESDNETIVGPDVGLQFLKQREEWEKQEEVNKERSSLHYQDILFDEAREHGVGFYEFSTDHEERQKQQKALNKIRDDTLDAQKQRADLKKSRDSIIANRVKIARARQRARLGLPPEEEKPEDENLYNTLDEKKLSEEKAAKEKEKLEKEKERQRKKHVRPWDKAKVSSKHNNYSDSESDDSDDEDIEWKPQRERHVMTQDEWNEKQREVRNQEFAPISRNFVKSDVSYDPNDFEEEKKTLFFNSKKFKRRNQSPESSQRGAAIPPPATIDYYGPSTSKQPKSYVPPTNIEASISAGLKFLREQVDKGNKHKWSAANDYTENNN